MKKFNFRSWRVAILFLVCASLFVSCAKDYADFRVAAPELNMTELSFKDGIKVGDRVTFEAQRVTEVDSIYANEWSLDDIVVSAESSYEFVAEAPGNYVLSYRAYNIAGEFNFEYDILVEE
ncbi:hypothetical protein ACJOV8_009820 [Formosa sp. 3Alg 14/1]|uniref:hypothetical protein n=1 Tax=unclassified Formosa TaxID=2644710 RepID=UPI0039BEAC24